MHRPPACDQKDVLHTLIRDETNHIIGKFWHNLHGLRQQNSVNQFPDGSIPATLDCYKCRSL